MIGSQLRVCLVCALLSASNAQQPSPKELERAFSAQLQHDSTGLGMMQACESLLLETGSFGEDLVVTALPGTTASQQLQIAQIFAEHGKEFSSFMALLNLAADAPEFQRQRLVMPLKVMARRLADEATWVAGLGTEMVYFEGEQADLAAPIIASGGGDAARALLSHALDGSSVTLLRHCLQVTPGLCIADEHLPALQRHLCHPGLDLQLRLLTAEAWARRGSPALEELRVMYNSLYPQRGHSPEQAELVARLHSLLVQLNGRIDLGEDPAGWLPNATLFVAPTDREKEEAELPVALLNATGVLLLALISLIVALRRKLGASVAVLTLSCAMLLVCLAQAWQLTDAGAYQAPWVWSLCGLALPLLAFSIWRTAQLRPWESTYGAITRKLPRRERDPNEESSRLLAHAFQQMSSLATPRKGLANPAEKMQALPAMTAETEAEIASVEATPRRGFRHFDALEVHEQPEPQTTTGRRQRLWYKPLHTGDGIPIEQGVISKLQRYGVEFMRRKGLSLGTRLRAILERGGGEVYKTRLHVVASTRLLDGNYLIAANIEIPTASGRHSRPQTVTQETGEAAAGPTPQPGSDLRPSTTFEEAPAF